MKEKIFSTKHHWYTIYADVISLSLLRFLYLQVATLCSDLSVISHFFQMIKKMVHLIFTKRPGQEEKKCCTVFYMNVTYYWSFMHILFFTICTNDTFYFLLIIKFSGIQRHLMYVQESFIYYERKKWKWNIIYPSPTNHHK